MKKLIQRNTAARHIVGHRGTAQAPQTNMKGEVAPVVPHAWDSSAKEAEAGCFRFLVKPGLHWDWKDSKSDEFPNTEGPGPMSHNNSKISNHHYHLSVKNL